MLSLEQRSQSTGNSYSESQSFDRFSLNPAYSKSCKFGSKRFKVNKTRFYYNALDTNIESLGRTSYSMKREMGANNQSFVFSKFSEDCSSVHGEIKIKNEGKSNNLFF